MTSYLLLANPAADASVAVRLTFTRPDGSGVTRDLTLGPWERRSLPVAEEPGLDGDTDVSVAVQALDGGDLLAEHSRYWGGRLGRRPVDRGRHTGARLVAGGGVDRGV